MDTFTENTQTPADTLPMLAEPGQPPEPFTCELGDETTHHVDFDAACKHVVDKLGPAHLVMRRDAGPRRIGIWRDEYDVTREPDAYISWAKGAKL